MQERTSTPGQPQILANAPRCGARTRSGAPCRSPAVNGNRRCRMHGGRGSGAPRGNRNAWKTGLRSARVRAIARYIAQTTQMLRVVKLIRPTRSACAPDVITHPLAKAGVV